MGVRGQHDAFRAGSAMLSNDLHGARFEMLTFRGSGRAWRLFQRPHAHHTQHAPCGGGDGGENGSGQFRYTFDFPRHQQHQDGGGGSAQKDDKQFDHDDGAWNRITV